MDINFGLLSTYIISLLLMIGLPIALGYFVIRYLKVSWWVVLTGVLTFIGSQALRIPASYGLSALFQNGTIPTPSANWIPVFNGLVAGLLAGVFEETARLVGFMFLKRKPDRSNRLLVWVSGMEGLKASCWAFWEPGLPWQVYCFITPGRS